MKIGNQMIDLSEDNIRRIAARNYINVRSLLLAIVDLNIVPHEELPDWIYNHSAVRSYRKKNFKTYSEIQNEAHNTE
jgi:hypothetical protein